ncbi:tetratricopeptide repeat protein 4-like [Littorina saxatilis]|uniref:Cns1/TTC4 wheel domain-containing protein n=1 Tax=Littorina saxatilis TaxID=31220 RepID=A0AAN9BAT9_9CAEN
MSENKGPMTDKDRVDLVQRLQDDLEDFVAERSRVSREKKENAEEDDKSIDEIAEELLNHPAFMKDVDWSKPLSEEMQGLMTIKYETENPVARAESYREEGNDLFKKKDYRVAIENYTEGIKSNSPDRYQNTVLYTNRAAAQYHLGNYRTAFNDCILARKFKPDHMKAIVRGALCCDKIKKHADTIRWCEAGLMIEPDNKELSDLKSKAEKAKKIQDRDERKQALKDKKEEEATLKLLDVIKSRHIHVAAIPHTAQTAHLKPSLLADLDPIHPSGARVRLDEKGVLHWPVLFLYPEYGQTDFIQSFSENDRLQDHVVSMFGPGVEPAPWDVNHKYTADNIQIFFEDRDEETLYPVSKLNTLLEVLQHKRYKVFKGTPAFIILPKDSDFQQKFLKQYKLAT